MQLMLHLQTFLMRNIIQTPFLNMWDPYSHSNPIYIRNPCRPTPHQDNATKCKREGRKLDFGVAKTGSNGEPRQVRSSGMRRDWSFEDPSKSSIGPRFW